MKDVAGSVNGNDITTYADDTYVLVKGKSLEELIQNTENCLTSHLAYLNRQGMITNLEKTEAVIFGEQNGVSIKVGDLSFKTNCTMKVLGVTMDEKLSWSPHIDKVVKKAKSLNSALKFIRNKLNLKQFLKVLTSQFFSTCFYGCQAWLSDITSYRDKRRLTSLHFRSLRIAVRDHRRLLHRAELDKLGRTRPLTWTKYQTASLVMKIVRNDFPRRLKENLLSNAYIERRKPGRLKFYDNSRTRIGRQNFGNRLGLLNDIDFDWTDGLTDGAIRTKLKKFFKMATPDGEVVFPLGRANEHSSSNPSFPPLTEPSGYPQGPRHCTRGTDGTNRH